MKLRRGLDTVDLAVWFVAAFRDGMDPPTVARVTLACGYSTRECELAMQLGGELLLSEQKGPVQ